MAEQPPKKRGINKFSEADKPTIPTTPVKLVRKWKPATPPVNPSGTAPAFMKAAVSPVKSSEKAIQTGAETEAPVGNKRADQSEGQTEELETLFTRQTHFEFYRSGTDEEVAPIEVPEPVDNDEQAEASHPDICDEEAAKSEPGIQPFLTAEPVSSLLTEPATHSSLTRQQEHLHSVLSKAAELCAPPKTPSTSREEGYTLDEGDTLGEGVELGIDLTASVDWEDGEKDFSGDCFAEAEEDGKFHHDVDFDVGSEIANEEEHDYEVEGKSPLDATFDESAIDETQDGLLDETPNSLLDVTQNESFDVTQQDEYQGLDITNPTNSKEHEEETAADDLKNKMETSFGTTSTADITFQTLDSEPASPKIIQASGPKSRYARLFSKAKLRFEKRKNLGKSSSNSDMDKACVSESIQCQSENSKVDEVNEDNPVQEEAVQPDLEKDDISEYNPDTVATDCKEFSFTFSGAEDYCSGSYVEGSETNDSGDDLRDVDTDYSFYSEADDKVCNETNSRIYKGASEIEQSYETEDTEDDDDAGSTSKYNFYTSTSINVYEEKKEINSFDEDGDKPPAPVSKRFSFYSSTPLQNTYKHLSNEDLVNAPASINDYDEEKKEVNSFEEDGDKPPAPAGKRFSFYSSTPLQNTQKHLSSEDLVNNSFLVEECRNSSEEEAVSEEESAKFDLYKSSPMNIESFDGSDAFVGEFKTGEMEVNEGMDIEVQGGNGECDNQLLNEPTQFNEDSSCDDSKASYTISLKAGCDTVVNTAPSIDSCSSRSFVSFREKKKPHSVHKPLSITAAHDCDEIEIKKADSESPTTVIDSLHPKTVDDSDASSLIKKYQLGRSLDVATSMANHTKASATMFTKQDIDIIAPLHIAHYLTLEERKTIGTKVLSEKMMRGYTIAVSTEAAAGSGTVCNVCDMPMLCKQNKNLGTCAICPVLKKKLLKRILNVANAEPSEATPVPTADDESVSEARKAILDVSKRQSYYDRAKTEEDQHTANVEWYVEGRRAVAHAREVLANRFNPSESPKKESAAAEHEISLSPRILFPDDCSVEVVQNDESLFVPQLTSKQTQPAAPPGIPTSPKGRPPCSPATPAAVKTTRKVSQCSVTSVAASRCSHNTAISSLGSQSHQQIKVKASSHSEATQCSYAHSVTSSAISAIQIQIEDTQHKLMQAQDLQKQILYTDVLTKLNGALLAVQKLEEFCPP